MSNELIRVLLVEDHPLYRTGLRIALSYTGFHVSVVHESENAKDAIRYITEHSRDFDFILLDYYLPDGTAMDVVRAAKTHLHGVKILIISAETNRPEFLTVIDEGVNGFISKDVTSQELSMVVSSIAHGHDYFDKTLLDMMDDRKIRGEQKDSLSPREIDIIRCCVKGMTAKQIAAELNISPRTVEKHKDRIFSKLGLTSTVDLVKYVLRNGLN